MIAYIDVVDACQMMCTTCIRGVRGMPNSARRMDFDRFDQILLKLKPAGYTQIGLYNWTEPFLNRSLEVYVGKAKAAGFYCDVSTTFSLRRIDNLEAAIVAGLDLIRVSISGIDQETYEINHAGGRLDYVLANLRRCREILDRHPQHTPQILLRFIEFPHNRHQIEGARAIASELGFDFEVIEGGGDPLDRSVLAGDTDTAFRQWMADAAGRESPEDHGLVCSHIFDQMTIDAAGDVYLCCAMPNHSVLKIGSYLGTSEAELLVKRHTHGFCRGCTIARRDPHQGDKIRRQAAFDQVSTLMN